MSDQQYIRIVNWSTYQHYRDRKPPWIKLHREILDSRMWVTGNEHTRSLAVLLMLLAAETNNRVSADHQYLIKRGSMPHQTKHRNLQKWIDELVRAEFIEIVEDAVSDASNQSVDASNVLFQRQRQSTETETEPAPPKSDSDILVETIARTHPANWRSKGSMIIPPAHCDAIIRALQRDGETAVREGTVAYGEAVQQWAVEERRMVVGVVKFYDESHYLKDPRLWEKTADGQTSKQQDRVRRNRETLLDALTESRHKTA